jgi:hypothetical protein
MRACRSTVFVIGLGAAFALLLVWGFTHLPREGWQFLAAVPLERGSDGQWRGLNLTYYGVFTATALLLAVMVFLFLLGAVGVSRWRALLVPVLVLAVALPAARLLAWLVERKKHTFTVGGASCAGFLAAPAAVWLVNALPWGAGPQSEPLAVPLALAALCTAYCFGEGVGRLACISFGCCYGKPLAEAGPFIRRLFAAIPFRFAGDTRKIAYASGWENTPVVPIQAVTAVVCLTLGLGGLALFLGGSFRAALLLAGAGSQLWRAVSECLRADYRGGGRISAYQVMSLATAAAIVALAVWPAGAGDRVRAAPDALAGLALLWHPAMILLLQGLWLGYFLHTGRSTVTGSTLSFHVRRERV